MTDDQLDPKVRLAGDIYCAIMNVVADRLDSIAEVIGEVSANPEHPKNWRNAEFCYLQVRKCVEYVAFAVLAAHQGHDYECDKLENAYKADVIFNDLAKINPHGFPNAVALELDLQGPGQHHAENVPTLSRRRMKRIYDACAMHLHAGKLSDILNGKVPPYDLAQVTAWHKELTSLLTQHTVMLPHVGMIMIAFLRDAASGTARVIFAQADGPFVVEGDDAVYNNAANP